MQNLNWIEFFWAIIWDLGVISWCFIIDGLVKTIARFCEKHAKEVEK